MKETLGTDYRDGDVIVREGEPGDCMYVVQSGRVEIVAASPTGERRIAVLTAGEYFGEMALFDQEVRAATARVVGAATVLRVDKKTLLRRITEDPSLAFNMLRELSSRLREAHRRVSRSQEDAR